MPSSTASVNPHRKPGLPTVHPFGSAPQVVPRGYEFQAEVYGTLEEVQQRFNRQYVVLVQGAELESSPGRFAVAVFSWSPFFDKWRHGGWYVNNLHYPNGAMGCVSCNYPDKKWRIVCDDRRTDLGQPGDFTFPSRDAAARAELELVNSLYYA